ncbi:ML domain-containing protein [Phycomyces nitens]|nr:ML domain-containing protein [Phycomyces nitens]
MKLSILVIATFASLASASFLPFFQNQQEQTYDPASTDLIKPCGSDADLLIIEDITLTPKVPVKGQNLTIDFTGFLKKEVTEGTTVSILVKYGVVQLIRKKFDFCSEVAPEVQEECPIPAGPLTFHKDVALPKEIPGGKYVVNAVITSAEGEVVTCLIGQTSFPRK